MVIPWIISCSSEKNTLVSRAYHNTTAHYNAYFYANERINEVESSIEKSRDNNYNYILNIFPRFDTSYATTYENQLEDVIKKASLAIQNHGNSKWVDDSYILIGRARFFSNDFPNAIETFKYVNTNSKDRNARHEALVYLMRTFIENNEMNNAIAVSDYLKKEKLNKNNLKLLYLTRAYYYQRRQDYDNMVGNLVLATPLLANKDGKARIYFIVGQIYQELNFDAEAYDNYKNCLGNNPDYELSFYAKLNMAQVTELSNTADVRRVRKYFRKLLRDAKNKEFKDKIYYEMAEFEIKQNNLEQAITFLEESLKASIGNQRQKGLSYLRLGRIYYDSLKQFETAKAYYDSTIQVLPGDYENYVAVKERQEVLTDFVQQLTTINIQDSMLVLADKDSATVIEELRSILTARETAKREKEKKKKTRTTVRRSSSISLLDETGFSTSSWYFDNPSAISLGQAEFERIWGTRRLEDNWRRSAKQTSSDFEDDQEGTDATAAADTAQAEITVDAAVDAELRKIIGQIPYTEAARTQSLTALEHASYRLGKIYYFDLQEETNAVNTFQTFLERFPGSKYEAEVLYLLYLTFQDKEDLKFLDYKDQLINKHPESTYAKLVINPNYRQESSAAIEKQKLIYDQAYQYFMDEDFENAIFEVEDGINDFPETIFTPNLKLLRILITGKTEDIFSYQFELDNFIKNYPESEVTDYAKTLLKSSQDFQLRLTTSAEMAFQDDFNQIHYFALVFDPAKFVPEDLRTRVDNFHQKHFPELDLKTGSLILSQEKSLVVVNEFVSRTSAIDYYDLFRSENNDLSPDIDKFVISRDNFNIFYQTKDLQRYMEFFERNY